MSSNAPLRIPGRSQFQKRSNSSSSINLTAPAWATTPSRPKRWPSSCAPTARQIRSERGYSATNYDGSAVKRSKTLRRQFGNFYDAKKVRNNK
jgi:hypothetical protein